MVWEFLSWLRTGKPMREHMAMCLRRMLGLNVSADSLDQTTANGERRRGSSRSAQEWRRLWPRPTYCTPRYTLKGFLGLWGLLAVPFVILAMLLFASPPEREQSDWATLGVMLSVAVLATLCLTLRVFLGHFFPTLVGLIILIGLLLYGARIAGCLS